MLIESQIVSNDYEREDYLTFFIGGKLSVRLKKLFNRLFDDVD